MKIKEQDYLSYYRVLAILIIFFISLSSSFAEQVLATSSQYTGQQTLAQKASLALEELEEESAPIPLIVAFDPNLPPFQFQMGREYTGFNLDIMDALAVSQRLAITYVPLSLQQSISALKSGEVDIILGVNFSAELHDHMEFTEKYFSSSIGILVEKDDKHIQNITDLSDSIVALQHGTMEYDFLRNIRKINYHITSNQVNALEVFFKGRADAFVGNRITAQYILQERGLEADYEFVESYLLPLEYSLAVQKENYRLLHILNTGIRNIKLDGTYNQIYDQWFASLDSSLAAQLKKVIQIVSLLFIIAIVLFFLSIRWNRQLQKEVEKKTRDLQKMNESLEYQILQTQNSDQFKDQILDSSLRGIVTCTEDGTITSYNPVALQQTGLTVRPMGRRIFEIPLVAKLLEGKMKKVLAEGKRYLGEESVMTIANQEKYLRYNVYPLYDVEKKIIGLILSFEDVTEERILRDQVHEQEKSRALIQLVAGIAHEIRNPLTSIKTFVELIPSKMSNKKFQQEISTHVPKEIERLNQLVEGLIDYAKPRFRQKKKVDIQQLVSSCLVLFEGTIHNKGFHLEAELEEELFLEVDENQMKQVLINLILNALESMEGKQAELKSGQSPLTIAIRLYSSAEEVYLEIEDEGQGMTEDEAKKVLEPFYTTKARGTGLGLALVHQYINENDGIFQLESKAGLGTKLQIRFEKKEQKNV